MTAEALPFLAGLEPSDLDELLAELSEDDAQALYLAERYTWANWARPEQLPPAGPWRFWICISGRGGGKTRTGAEWVNDVAEANPGCRVGLISSTKGDVRDVMVEDPNSGILACARPDFRPRFEPSKRRITWPNNSIAILYSADEPEQTRGANLHFVWADELGKWRDPKGVAGRVTAWENIVLACRLGLEPQILVTTTPRRVGRGAEIVKDLTLGKRVNGRRPIAPVQGDPAEWHPRENTIVRQWSTDRNAANLAASFLTDLDESYGGTTLEAQERRGIILDDVEGALFVVEDIEPYRVTGVPTLTRVLVAVDPSHADEGTGDGAGIIAGGLGIDGDVYVWDDRTVYGSPLTWAKAAVGLHNETRADGVVIETTTVQTEKRGHVVKDTIALVDPDSKVNWIEVHAAVDKYQRAQPVAALYEQGKIHHVVDKRAPDRLAALEDELVSWEPNAKKSPNRLDALVHLVTELKLKHRPAGLRMVGN
jgi:phage terminase large subunit-like protein